MTNYEFGSSLYRNANEMVEAIVEQWLSANGKNDLLDQLEALRNLSDEQLADECIEGWGLEQPHDTDEPGGPTWLAWREASRDDIVEAFGDIRKRLTSPMPVKGIEAELADSGYWSASLLLQPEQGRYIVYLQRADGSKEEMAWEPAEPERQQLGLRFAADDPKGAVMQAIEMIDLEHDQ